MAFVYYDENEPERGGYDDGTGDSPTQPPATGGGGTGTGTSTGTGGAPGEDVASPWSTPPADGDWGAWFLRNIKGTPANSASLAKLIPLLKLHGIEVLKNASGIYGKIKLPDGTIKDVGLAFSGGDESKMQWQWLDADGDGGDAPDWFDANMPAPDPYTTPGRPDYLQGEYKPPTFDEQFAAPGMDQLYADPGYQARLDAAQKGFQRSAAAKGSILSGGSQVALARQNQNIASDEYGKLFGRAFDTYRQKYGQFQDKAAASFGARQLNEGAYQSDVTNSLNQYGTRYRSYRDAVDDQFRLANLGLGATTAGAPN